MRAVVGDLLGAGAQARRRHEDLHRERVLRPAGDSPAPADLVVQPALHLGNRRRFGHEVGESHLDVTALRTQPSQHVEQQRPEASLVERTFQRLEQFDEARPVGASRNGRETHAQRECRHRRDRQASVLDRDRTADIANARGLDAERATVGPRLDIRESQDPGAGVHAHA